MLSGKWSRFQKKYQLLIKKNDSCESKPKLHVLFAMWPPPNSTFFAEKSSKESITSFGVNQPSYCRLLQTAVVENVSTRITRFSFWHATVCHVSDYETWPTDVLVSVFCSFSFPLLSALCHKNKGKKFKNHHLTIVGEISRPKQLDQNFETYLGKPCESLESLLNSV